MINESVLSRTKPSSRWTLSLSKKPTIRAALFVCSSRSCNERRVLVVSRLRLTTMRWSVLILLHIIVALPLAAPFANAGSGNAPYSPGTATQLPPPPQQPRQLARRLQAASAATSVPQQERKRPTLLRDFVSLLKPSSDYDATKGGEEGASAVSKLLYNYATPIIRKASQRRLKPDDAFDVPPSRKMGRAVPHLSKIYEHLQSTHRQQQQLEEHDKLEEGRAVDSQSLLLTKALLLHQRRMLIITGLQRLLNTCVQAFPALLVARLLRLVEAGSDQPVSRALVAAAQLVAVLTLKMVTENQYFHNVVKYSTAVRGSLAGLIFAKSLRLQSGGTGVTHVNDEEKVGGATVPKTLGAGGVLNLMQSDASIIESAALQFHTTWDGPLQIAIYTTLLFRYLGPSVLWGIAVLLLTIPVNSVALRELNRLSKYENEAKDARTKRTAESISSMKLLKLQGWEQSFADDIRVHRREELKYHVSRGLVRALNSAVSNAVPAIVLVVTLTAYVKTGRPIVASTIFTAISLFNQLRFPLFFYPMLIDSLANGRNAMLRISTFLSAEEIVPYVQHFPLNELEGGSVEMKHGNFLWPSTPSHHNSSKRVSAPPALADVNFKVLPGEVVAVVGSVGSGKSALIKGLLGELNPVSGTTIQEATSGGAGNNASAQIGTSALEHPVVIAHGDVAYCSQEAWLPKGSIRDAITFGRDYNEERYLAAIRDAGLDDDIVSSLDGVNSKKAASSGILSHDTDVGEGGSSLSGGQRARVALARALYSGDDTKVFLLDDCLAALDTRVGSTVFERMTKRLKDSKAATVLVTNDPSIPRRCDKVILMGSIPGSSSCSAIVDIGSYDELLARGHDLRSISAVEEPFESEKEESRVIDGHKTITAQSSDLFVEPVELTKIGTQKNIQVVDGYGTYVNGTDCYYADYENQVTMENCPDFIASQIESMRITENDSRRQERNRIDEDNQVFNHTLADCIQLEKVGQSVSPEILNQIAESGPSDALTTRLASADDSMSVSSVPISTYVSYFKSVGKPFLVIAMVASYLMANGAQFFQQYTVAKWTEVGGSAMGSAVGLGYLRSLVNAAGVVSLFLWIRSFLTMKVGVRASEFLHSRMLASVFVAPMSFFDATPSGQLMSRFGKEIETVDRAVPDSIGSVLFCFLQIFMSAGALAGIISSGMAVPLTVVAVLYVKMMSRFRPAARDMKRSETKTRSPIYTHFGEAIRGSETIRSIRGARDTWSSTHQSLSDTNLGVFYTVKALDRWLSTRLETLGNIVVLAAAVASVFMTRAGKLKAGSAGWGLTQSLAITGLLTWAVRCLTDLESNMMSVMRVKELTDLDSDVVDIEKSKSGLSSRKRSSMPKEMARPGEALVPLLATSSAVINSTLAPLESSALVKSGWPWRGNVQFSNVSMRYNPAAPLVLKGVTLTVPAGTTLGLVGRSGSGKSSLLLVLFRLVEIERGGSIEIDGVDIRSVDMETLRQSLAIIPQDPVLFTGTLAYNLDATGKASPEDMLKALRAASPDLAESFRRADGLATQISNSRLSVGERQLICLARALLRKSKILVLDEATSSVDSKTDQKVQETIRREFVDKGVSLITVAHRLDTVLGYDRIAVLGDGQVLEYGPPDELVAIPGGELQKLVLADRLNKQKGGKKKANEDKSSLVSA